jgi:hypothetical protein
MRLTFGSETRVRAKPKYQESYGCINKNSLILDAEKEGEDRDA